MVGLGSMDTRIRKLLHYSAYTCSVAWAPWEEAECYAKDRRYVLILFFSSKYRD
jgi:hypothetical protein